MKIMNLRSENRFLRFCNRFDVKLRVPRQTRRRRLLHDGFAKRLKLSVWTLNSLFLSSLIDNTGNWWPSPI